MNHGLSTCLGSTIAPHCSMAGIVLTGEILLDWRSGLLLQVR